MEREITFNNEEEVSTKFTDHTIITRYNINQLHRQISDITIRTETNLNDADVEKFIDHHNESENLRLNQNYLDLEKDLTLNTQLIKRNSEVKLFCVAANGSEDSELAFQLAKNFLNNHKMLVVYGYDSSLNETSNYRNRIEVVSYNFQTLISTCSRSENISYVESDKCKGEYQHNIEMVYKIGNLYNSNYFVLGYYGLRGPRGDNKELAKGLNFLLTNCKMPIVIVKEAAKSFKWLFVFDRASNDCHKIFSEFLPLIDFKSDKIHALTLIPSFINYDDIKRQIFTQLENAGENPNSVKYESEEYEKNPESIVIERINFGMERFDFLVLFNNVDRKKIDPLAFDAAKVIQNVKCNICILNGGLNFSAQK